jgi:hypothetical protein
MILENQEPEEIQSLTKEERESLERSIKFGEALERLDNNPDFRMLIRENYLGAKLFTMAKLMSSRHSNTREFKIEQQISITNFGEYLNEVYNEANIAKAKLVEDR